MKKYLSYIVTIVVWLAAFYIYLPAVNLKSQDFWWFMAFMAVSGLVINAGQNNPEGSPRIYSCLPCGSGRFPSRIQGEGLQFSYDR